MASESPPRIDLHIHSTASDGTNSPAEILNMACNLGVKAIAITDHDTTDGCHQALQIGIPDGLNFLTGVEISAAPPPCCNLTGSIHILGYSIQTDNYKLKSALDTLQTARKNRNPRILAKLSRLGFPISYKELQDTFHEGQIGRPHIARMMLHKGYVQSFEEAFDQFIGKGRPAYVDKFRIESQQAIDVIRNAGGIAVLAHPAIYDFDNPAELQAMIEELMAMGLSGLEVYYPEHTIGQTAWLENLATHFDLLETGGTDFHGSINPAIQLGLGAGDFNVPYEIYLQIQRHCINRRRTAC